MNLRLVQSQNHMFRLLFLSKLTNRVMAYLLFSLSVYYILHIKKKRIFM